MSVPELSADEKATIARFSIHEEDIIRADERERVAIALENERWDTWNGGQRRPSNFAVAAKFVRGL